MRGRQGSDRRVGNRQRKRPESAHQGPACPKSGCGVGGCRCEPVGMSAQAAPGAEAPWIGVSGTKGWLGASGTAAQKGVP